MSSPILWFPSSPKLLAASYWESAKLIPFEYQWLLMVHFLFCFWCKSFARFGNCEPSTWCSLWFLFWGTFLTLYLCMLLTSFLHLNVYMIMFVLGLVGSLKTKPNPCLCKIVQVWLDLIFGDQVHTRWSFETSSATSCILVVKHGKTNCSTLC
jgi:hypothetical protein